MNGPGPSRARAEPQPPPCLETPALPRPARQPRAPGSWTMLAGGGGFGCAFVVGSAGCFGAAPAPAAVTVAARARQAVRTTRRRRQLLMGRATLPGRSAALDESANLHLP